MWENAFYVGGDDDGIIEAGELTVGAAVCWELMRTQTVRRLAGKIDLAIGGSGWWTMPEWPPAPITRRIEAQNARSAWNAVQSFSTFLGVPFIHGAHAGALECEMPWSPLRYRGHFQGGAAVVDAHGRVLARRDWREGSGYAIAEVEPGRREPVAKPPDRFWLHPRGAVPAFTWEYQKLHGRPWYRKNVAGRPAAEVLRRAPPDRAGRQLAREQLFRQLRQLPHHPRARNHQRRRRPPRRRAATQGRCAGGSRAPGHP